MVKFEASILLSLSQAKLIVANLTLTALTAQCLSVISSHLAIGWAWLTSEVGNILANTSTNSESNVVLHLSSVTLVGVTMSLSMTHIIGEHIKLVIENSQVIDFRIIVC